MVEEELSTRSVQLLDPNPWPNRLPENDKLSRRPRTLWLDTQGFPSIGSCHGMSFVAK